MANTAEKTKDKKEEKKVEQTGVLIGPRITEKSVIGIDKGGVYVFNVIHTANKRSIAQAIHRTYKVNPTAVRLARTPDKKVFVRGKWGVKRGGKKAYVQLKKGDKIEIV